MVRPMVVKSEWAANKKFIHLRYMVKKAGSEELDSQQIIGFDPRRESDCFMVFRFARWLWLWCLVEARQSMAS
jgi:hypothetical protein